MGELVAHSTALASGLILIVMGAVVVYIAFHGNSMPSSGWQVELSARVQHYAHVVKEWAGALPGWVTGLGIFAVLLALVWRALRETGLLGGVQRLPARARPRTPRPLPEPAPRPKENLVER